MSYSLYGNVTLPTYSISAGSPVNITTGGSGYTLGAVGASTGTYATWTTATPTISMGKVKITDEDIQIGNSSLGDILKKFEERLAILVPNPALEKEFEQLKQLREQYIELESKLTEQKKSWDILKKTDT